MFTEDDLRRPPRDGHGGRLVPGAWPPLIAWVLLAGWLGFGAFAKFYTPNPRERDFDLAQATLEVVVIVLVLLGHRWRVAWMCVAMMFAGFSGWSFYAWTHNVACGCFGGLWTPSAWVSLAAGLFFVGAGVTMALNQGAKRDMIVVTAIAGVLAAAAGYFAYDVKSTSAELRRVEGTLATTVAENAALKAAIGEGSGAPDVDPCVLKYGNSPIERVMKLEVNRDLCNLGPDDPVWVIVIHDHDCHVCEMAKYAWDPAMEDAAASGDPVMQVRQFEINELETQFGIEAWNWEHTPNIHVIRRGEILDAHWYSEGESWTHPDDLRERIAREFFGG